MRMVGEWSHHSRPFLWRCWWETSYCWPECFSSLDPTIFSVNLDSNLNIILTYQTLRKQLVLQFLHLSSPVIWLTTLVCKLEFISPYNKFKFDNGKKIFVRVYHTPRSKKRTFSLKDDYNVHQNIIVKADEIDPPKVGEARVAVTKSSFLTVEQLKNETNEREENWEARRTNGLNLYSGALAGYRGEILFISSFILCWYRN